jgi:uncharacterized membrane-anchored protein YitT (DUF2179 family)
VTSKRYNKIFPIIQNIWISIWILGNIMLLLFGVTQLGHFRCFWKIHWELSQKPDVLGKNRVVISRWKSEKKNLSLACGKKITCWAVNSIIIGMWHLETSTSFSRSQKNFKITTPTYSCSGTVPNEITSFAKIKAS